MPGNNFEMVPLWREAVGRALQDAEDADDNNLRGAIEEYANGRTCPFYHELMLRELWYAETAVLKITASLYFGMYPDVMACQPLIKLAREDLVADVREAAVMALVHQDGEGVSQALFDVSINDHNRSIRIAASMALQLYERRKEVVSRGD